MTSNVETIWNDFASRLRNFIRARVRDHATAEDILQEVFLKIHRNLPTLRANQQLGAWVWRVTRNAITDHFRRVRAGQMPLDGVQSPDDVQDTRPDLAPCVRRFLKELAPAHREALILTEWQRLTQKELAGRLGISLSGAKSRVQRARGELKQMLLQCCRLELDRRGNIVEIKDAGRGASEGRVTTNPISAPRSLRCAGQEFVETDGCL